MILIFMLAILVLVANVLVALPLSSNYKTNPIKSQTTKGYCSFHHKSWIYHRGTSRLPPHNYREHDNDDDETAMIKVQSKLPIGYDMKKSLSDLPESPPSALNKRLIRDLQLNQILILSLATVMASSLLFFTDGFDAFSLSRISEIFHWAREGREQAIDITLTPLRLLVGIVASFPALAVGNLIEKSDARIFQDINFSTITMVLTLFGRRTSPPLAFVPDRLKGLPIPTISAFEVLLQSFLLASVTAVCEETVFRLFVPALLNHYFHSSFIALIGQSIIFGLGHTQPSSKFEANAITVGLQIINGLFFGLAFLCAPGGFGDLVPCIMAHAVYDFVVFFKTWLDANNQIEYSEKMALIPLPEQDQDEINQLILTHESQSSNPKFDRGLFDSVKRLFYLFDFDQNKSLSKSEVRKGFSYLALGKAGTPPPQKVVDDLFYSYTSKSDKTRLNFPDFFRLYIKSGAFTTEKGGATL